MTSVSQDLGDRLAAPNETLLDPAIHFPLLRLLATGFPVEVNDLARLTGRTPEQTRRALAATPETEYDDEGRIVGLGLTLRPTRHRFTLDGEQLYTWCALDTLIFPVVIQKSATIESTSPTSGDLIRVTATPTAVTSVEPTTAVVSLVNPEDLTSIRSSFCNQVHYFSSLEDAQPWLDDHPDGEVLPVRDAYRLASDLTTAMRARIAPAADASDTTEGHPCC